ncbi:hypothetical protein [Ruegeria atlantica]|uniref:hypothetical protein n=1 Tax=Ruegeria atlantica TaxID=81569 RepID=UPI0024957656|nr:hypothetical protein [Ruegeria atlantica]
MNELLIESLDQDGQAPGNVAERLPSALRRTAELYYADLEELHYLTVPYFSEVKDEHLRFHPKRAEDSQFSRSLERLSEVNGELPINQYYRNQGNAFVQELLKPAIPATVRRYLNQIRPIFNTAIRELRVRMENPLSDLIIPKDSD